MKYKFVPYEERVRICDLLDSEIKSRKEIAGSFNIPYTTVCNIYNDFCNNNNTVQMPKPKGKRRKLLDQDDINYIHQKIDENCTKTLDELRTLLQLERGKSASLETIRHEINSFNYSVKRIETIPQAVETPGIWEERVNYSRWFLECDYRQGKVIFLDETGFKVSMRRTRGRSLRGQTARLIVPAKKTRNLTLVVGISINNLEHFTILEEKGNDSQFLLLLNELFAKLPEPGYTFIIDNARFPHSEIVRSAVLKAGHFIQDLPAYSSFFNPIEFLFSDWKNFVLSTHAKTEHDLLAIIPTVSENITQQHLQNYFAHVNTNCERCIAGDRVFN